MARLSSAWFVSIWTFVCCSAVWAGGPKKFDLPNAQVCWHDTQASCFINLDLILNILPTESTKIGTLAFRGMVQRWKDCGHYHTLGQQLCESEPSCWWDYSRIKANCRGSTAIFSSLLTCPGTPAFDFYHCQMWHAEAGCTADLLCSWRWDLLNPADASSIRSLCLPKALDSLNSSKYQSWMYSTLLLDKPDYYGSCPSKAYMDISHYCPMTYYNKLASCRLDPRCRRSDNKLSCQEKSLATMLVPMLGDNDVGNAYLCAYNTCNNKALSDELLCEGVIASNTTCMPPSIFLSG